MISTLRSSDPPTVAEPDEIERSAEQIAGSVISMMRQFAGIKSRVGLGPEGDTSPLFLLVKGGLVERQADPDDGRASILVPTELGRAKVREHSQRRGAALKPVIADWSAQDRNDFLRLITKYTEGIEAHREELISLMLEHHGKGAS